MPCKRQLFQNRSCRRLFFLACGLAVTVLLLSSFSKVTRGKMVLVASFLGKIQQDNTFSGRQSPANKSVPGVTSSTEDSSDTTPCKRSLRFAPVPLPVTALASVQGSGNTWMRHLLQQMTGIYTGAIYGRPGDLELWRAGWYGEGITNGSVVAVKTHGLPSSNFQRAIVVLRNPYDAMFADFNRRASLSHTGVAPSRAYFEYWSNFSKTYADRWSEFHGVWIRRFSKPVFFLSFDELIHSLNTSLTRVAKFLHHPSLPVDIQCAVKDSVGAAKRMPVAFDKKSVFSRELTRRINGKIGAVQVLLKDKFPELSRIVGSWKRKEDDKQLKWKPMPPSIFKTRMCSRVHILQTVLHGVQIFLSYCLMLVFMTYNVYLGLSVILGATLGYFLTGWKRTQVLDSNQHCE